MHKILVLGGTTEAVVLAAGLARSQYFSPITSLAGRTRNPAKIKGHLRQGGFGGAGGMVD